MRLIATGLIFLTSITTFSQGRRVENLIEKFKYQDAYELLSRVIEKDSLAPAEKYIMSGLLFNKDYKRFDLDSAYWYVLDAIRSFNVADDKEQQRLIKNEYTPVKFDQLKKQIEDAGFQRARVANREQDYIAYLNGFPTSELIDSAIWYRNKVAFEMAVRENVYQSYKMFFDKYPSAEQVQEARRRYEKLLFITKTSDGKLESYQQFLRDYPETWHKKEAEQVIYNIITGPHTKRSYRLFFEQYPQSYYSRQAKLSFFSLSDSEEKEEILNANFFNKQETDSLRNLENLMQRVLIPSKHDRQYLVFDENGLAILSQIDEIAEDSKCFNDRTRLFLVIEKDDRMLITLDSTVLLKGDIVGFADRGDIVKIITNKKQYFIYANGIRTSSKSYTKAEFCGPFAAFEENNKWGMESFTGIRLLEPKYDSITSFGELLLIKKGKNWGIYVHKVLYPLLDENKVNLDYKYDDLEIWESGHLFVEKGKKSALFNKNGELIVPFADQIIEVSEDFVFIDRLDSIKDTRYSNRWYKDISTNNNWIIGKTTDNYDVYFNNSLLFGVENAEVLGNSAVLITQSDTTYCYFNDSARIMVKEGERISQVNNIGENSLSRHYLHTINNSETNVYNNRGELIELADFNKLVDLGDQYMLWHREKDFYLLDSLGNNLLKDIQAATSLDNGYITYLDGNKFGLFNQNDSTLIQPKYDKPLKSYSRNLFVVEVNDKYGIINRYDTVLVPAYYDEIVYLNDTLSFLKKNFRWNIWDLNYGKILLDGISNYWKLEAGGDEYYKIFKGIGYGIWSPKTGLVLNPTYGEISVASKGNRTVFVAEKWVEEADLVVMLYYNTDGELIRKEILSTEEYDSLICNNE